MKQRSKKSKSSRLSKMDGPPQPPSAGLSPARKLWFRLAASVVLPLLFIVGIETTLRLAGYGYRPDFFETIRVDGKDYLVNNENFSLRFFPPQLARRPSPFMMAAKKAADTCRIFVLGESAARGEPEPPFAASRYLEALLSARYPQTRFEVINLGITAINSHVVLPIARDCARQQGDMWIIYMGNNEMVGPFGAATVFGAKAPPLLQIRLNLAIQSTRLGQLLAALGRRFKGGNSDTPAWGGMEMFVGNQLGVDDPRKERVYQNFQENLRDIVKAGLDSGATILLNTVAVNLKDCPPFASMVNSNLPAADRAQFDGFYGEACAAEAQGHFAEAAQKFARAARLDAAVAELQFRWGESLLSLTNAAAAREHLQQACDDDALPFRADSRINGIIARAGRPAAGNKLVLFDAATVLATNLAAGVCGQETFYEHVHFNFDGNYRLGRAWAEQVQQRLPLKIARTATAAGWASQDACEQWLGLTDWNRDVVLADVMNRLRHPPLSRQLNNARRLEALQGEVQELRQRMTPAAADTAGEIYRAALERAPNDHFLHENFAEFLESTRAVNPAAAQWQQVCELMPHDAFAFYQAGRLLALQGQWAEAQSALSQALALRPGQAEVWYELGNVQLGLKQFEPALREYDHARQLDPQNAMYCAATGNALSKLDRHAEAIPLYRQAVRLQPEFLEAHFALGAELVAGNQIAEASHEFAEAVRLQPGNPRAHFNYGVMLAREGQLDEALQELQETMRLDPGNRQAQAYFNQIEAGKRHLSK
ncbi:MAG: tetratricopeptide repeat protein [Verrucomicrobiia bacterium]